MFTNQANELYEGGGASPSVATELKSGGAGEGNLSVGGAELNTSEYGLFPSLGFASYGALASSAPGYPDIGESILNVFARKAAFGLYPDFLHETQKLIWNFC